MQANAAQNAFANWKLQNPGLSDISYLVWLNSTAFGCIGYGESLTVAQAEYDKQIAVVAELDAIANKPLADAKTNAKSFTSSYLPPGASKAISVPTTTIYPDLSSAVTAWDHAPANVFQLDKTFIKDTKYTSAWSEHVQVSETGTLDLQDYLVGGFAKLSLSQRRVIKRSYLRKSSDGHLATLQLSINRPFCPDKALAAIQFQRVEHCL
jgi:hypothetical protein